MTDEKSPTIRKVPGRRDPTCFETQHAILIPAGTMLRVDEDGKFTCPLAFGVFSIDRSAAEAHPDTYRKVISA